MPRTLALVAMALVAAACSFGTATPTTTSATAPTVTDPSGGTTTVPEETTTTEDPATAATRAAVEALIPVTEELRGLTFLQPPNITIVTPAGLEARVRELIAEELDPDEVLRDEAAFRLLGVLEPGQSLERLYLDLFGEQVGGFYDSRTGELVVPVSEDGFLVRERTVVVHELVHALTDQHFGFGERVRALVDDEEEYDRYGAFQAVIEGDAVRIESAYIQSLTPEEIARLVAEYDALDSTVFDAAPHFIRQQLVAPYLDGLEFLRVLRADNARVDELYRRPPTSTEQVLHPEKYEAGEEPIPVVIDTPVPAGYEVGEESTWGQSALESLLGAVLTPAELRPAVEGWGGDRYRILFDGTDAVFEYHFVGDEPGDVRELGLGFRTYLRAKATGPWTVRSDGTTLVVLVAADREVLEAIVAALPGFEPVSP